MARKLPKRYTERTKLRIVKCSCGNEFPSRMLLPKCSECYSYVKHVDKSIKKK